MTLVEELVRRQTELGEADEAFARRLGVSRPMWVQVRAGKRRPGPRFVRGVLRHFPVLADQCVVFLRDSAPEHGLSAPVTVATSHMN